MCVRVCGDIELLQTMWRYLFESCFVCAFWVQFIIWIALRNYVKFRCRKEIRDKIHCVNDLLNFSMYTSYWMVGDALTTKHFCLTYRQDGFFGRQMYVNVTTRNFCWRTHECNRCIGWREPVVLPALSESKATQLVGGHGPHLVTDHHREVSKSFWMNTWLLYKF